MIGGIRLRLAEYFPEFASELSAGLIDAGHPDLSRAFSEAAIVRNTHDASCNACYIYLEPSCQANMVEANLIGVKHGKTIPIDHPFWVYVDVDNFNRPTGI